VVATEQYPEKIVATLPELAELLSEPVIAKMTFSCLREPAVRSRLDALAPRQVIVVGIEAHVCVLQTAADLLSAGVAVQVPYDAVASRRPTDRDTALARLASAGAAVTATESVLFELLERAGTDEFRSVSALIKQLPVP
jgi:nicotinamidase-related amidase